MLGSKDENNNFLRLLERKNDIKLCFMLEKINWNSIALYNSYYSDNILLLPSSTLYLRNKFGNDIDPYDLILLSENGYYNDKEVEYLKNLAKNISKEYNKNVTIGYSYYVEKERRNNILDMEILLLNYNLENNTGIIIKTNGIEFNSRMFLDSASIMYMDSLNKKTNIEKRLMY